MLPGPPFPPSAGPALPFRLPGSGGLRRGGPLGARRPLGSHIRYRGRGDTRGLQGAPEDVGAGGSGGGTPGGSGLGSRLPAAPPGPRFAVAALGPAAAPGGRGTLGTPRQGHLRHGRVQLGQQHLRLQDVGAGHGEGHGEGLWVGIQAPGPLEYPRPQRNPLPPRDTSVCSPKTPPKDPRLPPRGPQTSAHPEYFLLASRNPEAPKALKDPKSRSPDPPTLLDPHVRAPPSPNHQHPHFPSMSPTPNAPRCPPEGPQPTLTACRGARASGGRCVS